MLRRLVLESTVALLFLAPTAGFAQLLAPMAVYQGAQLSPKAEEPPPLRIAERFGVAPIGSLPSASVAAVDQLNAVAAWNRAGKLPVRNGITRPLPSPQWIHLRAPGADVGPHAGGAWGQSDISSLAWGTSLAVEGAQRLRLHLTEISLPESARLWVYGELGDFVGPFGSELVIDESMWTPSVAGSKIYLEVELPASSIAADDRIGFRLDQVAELFPLNEEGSPATFLAPKVEDPSCLIDATCISSAEFPAVEDVRKAIGHLEFMAPEGPAICTGALINDLDEATTIPYLLTANHCFATPVVAKSLQVFWRWATDSCFGSPPPRSAVPRSVGSTLVTGNPVSDFTLVRLGNDVPGDSRLLGWDARAQSVSPGTILHRISHPAPGGLRFPQSYSRSKVVGIGEVCSPNTVNVVGEKLDGGIFGGSSGSPVLLANGAIVGQLTGQCGNENGCDFRNLEIDGWFGRTFNDIVSIFQGDGGGDTSPCVEGEFTLCAVDGRFEITATAPRSLFPGLAGRVSPVMDADLGGALHFFQAEKNFHIVTKIKLRPSGYFAFSAVALDPLEWTVKVRDTLTGKVKRYTNPQGGLGVPTDIKAFKSDP